MEAQAAAIAEVTTQELMDDLYRAADNTGIDLMAESVELKWRIKQLINSMEKYKLEEKKIIASEPIEQMKQKRQLQKEMIYQDFFRVQNLINHFLGQRVLITYVHIDDTGKREIRLIDNDLEHLQATTFNNGYGRKWASLGYIVEDHYRLLKNSLSDDENRGLDETAKEVESRYLKYRGKILWKINSEWYGYKLYNKGPINEAYAAFYIHEIQLNNSLHENINTFMVSVPHGCINADNANGFLIGDTSLGGLQFAVKGAFGSAQSFTKIIAELRRIDEQDFSPAAFQEFVNKMKYQEQEKATSLITPLSKRSLSTTLRYHGEELLSSITPYLTK